MTSERIAVVGSGVSGLTAAYLLARQHHVTLYERDARLGGHAHTHTVTGIGGAQLRVDSGFIVHNDRTYPHLLRLFAELGIATQATEMSMSIRDPRTGLEYAGGRGLAGFVAQPRNLLNRDYLTMLRSVRRFHALALDYLDRTDDSDQTTYGEFITAAGFPEPFIELYAVPVVSCVWSSGRGDALDYPARYLFTFLNHHGLLEVKNSPQWRTVVGGSATYVDAIATRVQDVRRAAGAVSITRSDTGVSITLSDGSVERHDRVVIATHADDALAVLADPSPAERDVLGAFRYSRNETVLHQDPSLMPRSRRAQASWNYQVAPPGEHGAPVVTYWMNRLQGLDQATPLFVTLNAAAAIDPSTVIATMAYDHPIHDLPALNAQRRIGEITSSTTAYAGAHWGWGFHEDGCRSGVEAARAFGVTW